MTDGKTIMKIWRIMMKGKIVSEKVRDDMGKTTHVKQKKNDKTFMKLDKSKLQNEFEPMQLKPLSGKRILGIF
jgi:hypothetical protein